MITNDINEKIVERILNRIEQLNESIIIEIGKNIKNIGELIPSKAYQIKQMLMYGESLDKIVQKITKVTKLNVQDIYDIFEEEAKLNLNFAKQFYQARGKDFVPYKENILLQNQVRAMATMTANKYMNLSNTMAFASFDKNGNIKYSNIAKTYQDIIDKAILSVAQGKETYQQVMGKSMKLLASKGIRTVDYATGNTRRLDTVVRMNILDSMRNMSNELQKQFGEEYGADGVEISVHSHPAPDHEDIQGHQFSNEEFKKFQEGYSAIDYKGNVYKSMVGNQLRRPISEYNCYHYIFSIVLGVSNPEYTQEQLDSINKENQKGFEYDGEHYTMYEGTQLQRQLEVEIRTQRDIEIGAKASGNIKLEAESKLKIKQLLNKYKQLCDTSGLNTKYQRLRVW